MTSISSRTDEPALALALSLAASADCRISRPTIQRHFSEAGAVLISKGFLRPEGHVSAIAAVDDVPVAVEWLAERSSFGYFSETEGWVDLPTDSLADLVLEIGRFVQTLTTGLDIQPRAMFTERSPGLVWELGTCRLPERAARVPLWVARRLHDPVAWQAYLDATRMRPAQGIRLVLHLAESEDIHLPLVAHHAIMAVGAVVSATDPFQIDPQIVAARLKSPMSASGPITLSADGGHLVVNGKSYTFRGGKQRAIVRALHEAWLQGAPRCLTEEVLMDAGSADSTRRLARAFKGHKDWHEIIREQDGSCWLEA